MSSSMGLTFNVMLMVMTIVSDDDYAEEEEEGDGRVSWFKIDYDVLLNFADLT